MDSTEVFAKMTQIVLPTLGESVSEATVTQWLKKEGERVSADEPIVELETAKVTLEVNAPEEGIISRIIAPEGSSVEGGTLLGEIGSGGRVANDTKPETTEEKETAVVAEEGDEEHKLSPTVRNMSIEKQRCEVCETEISVDSSICPFCEYHDPFETKMVLYKIRWIISGIILALSLVLLLVVPFLGIIGILITIGAVSNASPEMKRKPHREIAAIRHRNENRIVEERRLQQLRQKQLKEYEERKRLYLELLGLTINKICQEHIKTLSRKRKQLIRKDDYGNVITDTYDAELKYFLENVVYAYLTEQEISTISLNYNDYVKKINKLIDAYDSKNTLPVVYSDDLSPREFEIYCADLLEHDGWTVNLGKGVADQGVDITCEKDGLAICIQCKQYSQPVGNKAVQEAYAGKTYAGADIAAVVTNSTYTKAAHNLASTNNVLLLHYEDLKNLELYIDSRFLQQT